jgi:low affinity Fe/Cu permease
MPIIGLIALSSPWSAWVVAVGLAIGWVLRRKIVDWFEIISWALPAALSIYGIVLTIGGILGLSHEGQLLIITATTVIVFELQFWCFSDPSIVANPDQDK